MSAVSGICNFDNRPLDAERLVSLWNSLAERGPDGGDWTIKGHVGFCFRAFHTNRESREESQPYVSINGDMLVADLRIDNRDELIPQLRDFLTEGHATVTDVSLAMAAYHKWGNMFPLHLVGEYALILYDASRQNILLARDHIGARPLYYYKDKGRLIFSSELLSLLAAAGVPLEVNDDYIAGYLAYDPEPHLTPFKKFRAVKPFHVVLVTKDGQLSEKPYWRLDPDREIRYARDEDYAEEFVHHFRNALLAPLRSDRPVFAELSGGLDSSSIVCVADDLLASGLAQAPRLETISQVFDNSPTSDERRFIRLVEEQRGQPSHYLCEEDQRLFHSLATDGSGLLLNPLLFCAGYHHAIEAVMSRSGARVLLSGTGGDQIMCSTANPTPDVADLLVQGRVGHLHRRLQLWSSTLRQPYADILLRHGLLPLLPQRIQGIFRGGSKLKPPDWFAHRFANTMNLRDRMFVVPDPFRCRLPSNRDQSIGFWSVVRGIACSERRALCNVEVSYPYLHRPLVEFMQAIPYSQRVRPGETRSLTRRGLGHLLPDRIARRKGKGNPTEALSRAFAESWPQLQELAVDSRVSAYGYVEAKKFRAALDQFRHGIGVHSSPLLKALALEVWLRALESRKVMEAPCAHQTPRRATSVHKLASRVS